MNDSLHQRKWWTAFRSSIDNTMTPRPYISFSQMAKFEMDPKGFVEEYIYNVKTRLSKNMLYGVQLADGLENEEATGDALLDIMMSRIPKFELRDKIVESENGITVWYEHDKKHYTIPFLENGDEKIPILAKPDTAKKDYSAFKEYKSSVRRWTQKKADQSGQITFYATAMWLVTGAIPEDIELVNVETAYTENNEMTVTGNMVAYKTKRTMVDVIKMTKRIKNAWAGIKKLCEQEIL